MGLEEKVKAVERVLLELDEEIKQFQSWSSLGCKSGCGKCCFKPDIEATPLEFLPFAWYQYKEGKTPQWLEHLDQLTDDKICVILNPSQAGVGLCSDYVHRGLICRLFGFSARTNKYEKKELVTCSIIKTEQAEKYHEAELRINTDGKVTVMSDYYLKLYDVDPILANQFMPINMAIKHALEIVFQYFSYLNAETGN